MGVVRTRVDLEVANGLIATVSRIGNQRRVRLRKPDYTVLGEVFCPFRTSLWAVVGHVTNFAGALGLCAGTLQRINFQHRRRDSAAMAEGTPSREVIFLLHPFLYKLSQNKT